MPTFRSLMHAALTGFTWSDHLDRFVRFLIRSDRRGYDVDIVTHEAVLHMNGRLIQQHAHVPLTEETLRRLEGLSTGLSDCRSSLDGEPHVKVVLDLEGHTLDLKHERRVIGL